MTSNRAAILLVAAAVAGLACSSRSASTTACEEAGGRCVLGSGLGCDGQLDNAGKLANGEADGCTTNPPNPGGGICCLPCPSGESNDGGTGCH